MTMLRTSRSLVAGLLLVAACDAGMPTPTTPATSAGSTPDEARAQLKAMKQRMVQVMGVLERARTAIGERGLFSLVGKQACRFAEDAEPGSKDYIRGMSACLRFKQGEWMASAAHEYEGPYPRVSPELERTAREIEDGAQAVLEAAENLRAGRTAEAQKKEIAASQAAKRSLSFEVAYQKVVDACIGDVNICKKKCAPPASEPDMGPHCMFMAKSAENEREFDKAADYMQRACNVGFWNSCEQVDRLRKSHVRQQQLEAEELARAFEDLVPIADDLAKQKFVATRAAQLGGRAAQAIPRIQQYIQLKTKESYCPQRKLAVKALGLAEFQKRAADHCKTDAPTSTGNNGEEVSLVGECRAVFASACP